MNISPKSIALAALITYGSLAGEMNAALISYRGYGALPFTTSSFLKDGVIVTGSDDLYFSNGKIGVVGGYQDYEVDPNGGIGGEYLEFKIDGGVGLFQFFKISSGSFSNINGNGVDSYLIEGFDRFGISVGTYDYTGSGIILDTTSTTKDYVSRLGGTPLSRMRIKAIGDTYAVTSILVEIIPIPEPSSAVLLGIGALGLAARRRRTS